jgi:hypothetical protein
MGGGWNWLWIVSNGEFYISGVEPSGSATRELVEQALSRSMCVVLRHSSSEVRLRPEDAPLSSSLWRTASAANPVLKQSKLQADPVTFICSVLLRDIFLTHRDISPPLMFWRKYVRGTCKGKDIVVAWFTCRTIVLLRLHFVWGDTVSEIRVLKE